MPKNSEEMISREKERETKRILAEEKRRAAAVKRRARKRTNSS